MCFCVCVRVCVGRPAEVSPTRRGRRWQRSVARRSSQTSSRRFVTSAFFFCFFVLRGSSSFFSVGFLRTPFWFFLCFPSLFVLGLLSTPFFSVFFSRVFLAPPFLFCSLVVFLSTPRWLVFFLVLGSLVCFLSTPVFFGPVFLVCVCGCSEHPRCSDFVPMLFQCCSEFVPTVFP